MTEEHGQLAELLRRLEESLMDPAVRANASEVATLLHEDFAEIGQSGRIYDKASIIYELQREASNQNFPCAAPSVHDFELHSLSTDTALVTYRTVSGPLSSPKEVFRSSIWQFINGAWRVRFHQGTPVRAPEPRGT
ncbi:MAG TPA: DUF4440 domain-containing protein [Acidisarcina sp.]